MILSNGIIVDSDFKLKRCDIRTEGRYIAEIGENLNGDKVDMTGKFILPGFIDTHIHGCAGTDVTDDDFDCKKMLHFQAENGTTSLLLTAAACDINTFENRSSDCSLSAIREQNARVFSKQVEYCEENVAFITGKSFEKFDSIKGLIDSFFE